MPTDNYTTVLYNDGEGVDYTDLNNTGRGILARLTDSMLERAAGYLATANKDPHLAGEAGANPANTSLAYTMTGGCAIAAQGSTATRIKLLPGVIFQKVGSAAGTESTFMSYQVGASDVDLVIGAGHATLQRIDILQVKLEWVSGGAVSRDFKDATTGEVTTTTPSKTRRIQATFSLKAGTGLEHATAPTYPTLDAGYCLVAAVRVPATWATGVAAESNATGVAVIRQCTVPLNIQHYQMTADEFDIGATGLTSNWARGATGRMSATGAGTNLIVWAPSGSTGKRIVGVGITAVWVTSGVVELKTVTWNVATGYTTSAHSVQDLSSTLVVTGGTHQQRFAHLGVMADASDVSNPSGAAGPVGDPYWCGGGVSGPARTTMNTYNAGAAADWLSKACLLIDAGVGSDIISVDWYLAG